MTLSLLLITGLCKAQNGKLSTIDFKTPNAASLGKFDQLPVNTFNGLPQISIPLYTFSYKDISLPINMSYHAAGNRTEDMPGWLGQGWSLSAGGSVNRIVNGLPDEIDRTLMTIGTYVYNSEQGNFFRSGYFNRPDWSSANVLIDYLNTVVMTTGQQPFDGEPDEFTFSAGDFSGSFYFYRGDNDSLKVKVKSQSGEYIHVETAFMVNKDTTIFQGIAGISPIHLPKITIKRTFSKFIISRSNGYKYEFGGDLSSMDLTTSFSGVPKTMANTWYLTKITSASGQTVSFNYKKAGDLMVQKKSKAIFCKLIDPPVEGAGNCSGASAMEEYNLVIQHPSYLAEIVAPNGTKVKFTSSRATQLDYDWISAPQYHVAILNSALSAPWLDNFIMGSYGLKLDAIEVDGLKYVLNYNNDSNERLQLLSMDIKRNDLTVGGSYGFQYNPLKLPAYNAKQSDHWGYYNGVSYNNMDYTLMSSLRVPDTAKMKAEILTKIIYPTGGSAGFEYEPHDFSKIAAQYPFELRDSVGYGGGLRIHKITIKADANPANHVITEYIYKNADNSSSGILSQMPLYTISGKSHVIYKVKIGGPLWGYNASEDYQNIYKMSSENMLNPMSNTNGGPVSYTRVLEKRIDNSYTEFGYSNFNTVQDQEPVTVYNNMSSRTIGETFTSRQNERGLLLNKSVYNASGTLVSKSEYKYNDDPLRFDDYVKTVNKNIMLGALGAPFVRVSANKIYTFYPYLKSETNTSYDPGGLNPIVSTKSYTYNNYRLVRQTESSKSDTTKKYLSRYTYAAEVASGNNAYAFLKSNFILDPVVLEENLIRINNTDYLTAAAIYTYQPTIKKFRDEDYLFETSEPVLLSSYTTPSFSGSLTYDNRFKLRNKYTYDGFYGNLSRILNPQGTGQGYLWGYQHSFPIADFQGKVSDDYFAENFEDYKTSITMDAHTGDFAYVGNYNTANKITVMAGKSYSLSYFVKSDNGWVFTIVPYTGQMISGIIDDIRIYPSDVLVNSYTYAPYSGLSSKIDSRGQTSYYNYNVLKQLIHVLDHKGNIIGTKDYNYGSGPAVFYNYEQRSTVTRPSATCPAGYTGGQTVYKVPAGKYAASSQSAANALALQDIATNAQQFANTSAICIQGPTVYAKLSYENVHSVSRNDKADIVIRFYSDAAMTQPYSVTNFQISYSMNQNEGESITDYTKTGSGTSIVLEVQALTEVRDLRDGSVLNRFAYSLAPSTLYQIL